MQTNTYTINNNITKSLYIVGQSTLTFEYLFFINARFKLSNHIQQVY